jgi:hypothetical protein
MKKIFLLLILFVLLYSCNKKYNAQHHIYVNNGNGSERNYYCDSFQLLDNGCINLFDEGDKTIICGNFTVYK